MSWRKNRDRATAGALAVDDEQDMLLEAQADARSQLDAPRANDAASPLAPVHLLRPAAPLPPPVQAVEHWPAPPAPTRAAQVADLVSKIAESLGTLRSELGVAYRTQTWMDDVLPRLGVQTTDPGLLRDLLGICALEAGGLRTDIEAIPSMSGDEAFRLARDLHVSLVSLLTRLRAMLLDEVLPPLQLTH